MKILPKSILLSVIVILLMEGTAMARIKGIHKLNTLTPEFREQISGLLNWADMEFPNETIVIACTYRSPEEQDRILKEKGSKATNLEGGKSKHQHGLAIDLYFIRPITGIASYDKKYLALGEKAEELGMTWGGRWKVPFDPGHFESKRRIE